MMYDMALEIEASDVVAKSVARIGRPGVGCLPTLTEH